MAALISGAVMAEKRARRMCLEGFWDAAGRMLRTVQSMTCGGGGVRDDGQLSYTRIYPLIILSTSLPHFSSYFLISISE